MIFYCGTHVLSHAKTLPRAFISVNLLRDRKSDFVANRWIMDSGAFTEISQYGHYRSSVKDYANQVERWSSCGTMELAVAQDYMCESFVLEKTGLTIREHQELTINRYDELRTLTRTPILPVLQGYDPTEYVEHVRMYGSRLKRGMRVGVGSVCKRNGNKYAIIAVLSAIKYIRPDLKLHGFGLKTTALSDALVSSLLYSADSMAWSYAARRSGGNRNGIEEAMAFTAKIGQNKGSKPTQLSLGNAAL